MSNVFLFWKAVTLEKSFHLIQKFLNIFSFGDPMYFGQLQYPCVSIRTCKNVKLYSDLSYICGGIKLPKNHFRFHSSNQDAME